MKEDKKFWQLYGWINRGRQRKLIIAKLTDKPITGEEFRKQINATLPSKNQLSLREISRHFTTFTQKEIMICLTPDVPYGKLYVLTDKGKRIQKELTKSVKTS